MSGVASQNRGALPFPEVTLEHEADLPVRSLSAPSVRVLDVDGPSLVTDESGCAVLGRTVFDSEDDASLDDIGVHSRGGTDCEFAFYGLPTMRWSLGASRALTHMNFFL